MAEQDLINLIENGFKLLAARIDEVIASLGARIDEVNASLGARIDEVNASLGARIDEVNASLGARIDEVNASLGARIDEVNASLGARIDATRTEMREEFASVNARLDGVEHRLVRVETEIEFLRGKTDFVIEGILNLDQKLDRHVAENHRQFDAIEDHFGIVHSAVRLSHLRGEGLDARVTALESIRH